MLGFPGESEEEIYETINFAVQSRLDIAAFFKMNSYSDIVELYKAGSHSPATVGRGVYEFQDLGYYSSERSCSDMPPARLNAMIILAQQKFYLNWKRIKKNFRNSPHKFLFIKNIFKAAALITQAYLIRELAR